MCTLFVFYFRKHHVQLLTIGGLVTGESATTGVRKIELSCVAIARALVVPRIRNLLVNANAVRLNTFRIGLA